jgi:DNA polymerase elongation subunit (family B)
LKTLARQLTTNSSYSTLVHPLTDEEYLDLKKSISENALFCVTKTIDKIMTGEIEAPDLVISKQLRMDITKYRNIFPHVAAAIQLSNGSSKRRSRNDMNQYIYTNSQQQNPLNRVVAVGDLDCKIDLNYDKVQGDVAASETVLGIFGFDRTLYGKTKRQEMVNAIMNYKLFK